MTLAVVDGVLGPKEEAVLSITDDGLLRGDGAFEVIRLYAGVPWALDEHIERLSYSCNSLRLPFRREALHTDIELLLAAVGTIDAFLRLVVTRGGRQISCLDDLLPPATSTALATVVHAPSPLLSSVKSLSYAAHMLAVRIAEERGADDALLVTQDGTILEASRASLFYDLGGKLYTPPLSAGILDSITRRHLLAVTRAEERPTRIEDLSHVSEAFIASTTKEVLAVSAIDDLELAGCPGPRTLEADAALHRRIAASGS